MRVRVGPRVERLRFDSLPAAVAAIEERGRELERTADRLTVDFRVRRFEPVQQVTARLELSGPGRASGGIDVRGDGSSEAYIGRVRRRVLEQTAGESPYDALLQALAR